MKKLFVLVFLSVAFLAAGCGSTSSSPENTLIESNGESPTSPPKEESNGKQNENPSPKAEDCKIKGNISSSGEKIYHVPGGQYYNVTEISTSKGERYFCSEAEAIAAGWRESQR